MNEAISEDFEVPEGLAKTREEFFERLKELDKPLTVEDIKEILNTTVKCDGPNKVITFLGMLLTYTECEQINIGFLAESSTGKSYIPLELSWYFPRKDIIKLGYASPTAFFHEWGKITENEEGEKSIHVDLANKLLIFLDMPHSGLLERLRPLLSHDEKQIEVRITDKNQKYGMKTKKVIVKGFPTVIFCSANESLSEQEKTRLLLLSPEKSQEKLFKALILKVEREGDRKAFNHFMESEPSRTFLRARVQIIRTAHIKHIIIPENLRKEIINRFLKGRKWLQPRHLRDISRLLALIKANALLNYMHRERHDDNIIVNMEDVNSGFNLYQTVSEANELGLSPELFEIYKTLKENDAEGYTINEFQKFYMATFHKPLGYEKARRILKTLTSAGLLTPQPDENDKRLVRYTLQWVGVDAPNPSMNFRSIYNEEEGETENYSHEDGGNSTLVYPHPRESISEGSVLPLSPSEAGEKCELCGARAAEYKVFFNGQWLKRCRVCLDKMKTEGLSLHFLPLEEASPLPT